MMFFSAENMDETLEMAAFAYCMTWSAEVAWSMRSRLEVNCAPILPMRFGRIAPCRVSQSEASPARSIMALNWLAAAAHRERVLSKFTRARSSAFCRSPASVTSSSTTLVWSSAICSLVAPASIMSMRKALAAFL